MNDVKKLTDIDLSELQIGEKLIVYRGSPAFVRGPLAAGYAGEGTVTLVTKKGAHFQMPAAQHPERMAPYRLRFKDAAIVRVPSGEPTMLYVHARGGRPTVTAYFTDGEYALVKKLLAEEAKTPESPRSHRLSLSALERMDFHDGLRLNGGR